MSKKLVKILALLLGLTLLLSGCGGANQGAKTEETKPTESTAENAQSGGNLIFGLSGEPATLDPAVQGGTFQRAVKECIYRGLVNYGRDGKIVNELAESYTVSEDGKTYTFKLRQAKFHNGDPVTAEDVKFSLERILDPKTGATYMNELSIIDKIEAVDDSTVKITLKNTYAPFIHYLALPESAIVSKKWTEEKGGDLSGNPMGAGPFQFVDWTKGQDINVKKFPDFYKENTPKLDSIKFVFYTDENTRVNALKAGDVDIIEYVPWKDATTIENDPALKLDSAMGPFMMLQFNTHFKPFSDPKVRQAISYAIDRTAIINTAFNGRGEPIFGLPIPKGYLGYNEKYNNYFKYDPEKAKQLLTEAGYPNGFKATLLATSQYSMHQQTAVVVQAELKKVGIDVTLELPDWPTRIEKNLKGEYDFLVAGTSGDITDPDWLSNFFYGGDIRLNNSAYFNDPEINRLLDEGRTTLDESKRKEIYDKFSERALELSPFVFLTWREQSYGMKKEVEGFQNLPGFLSFQSGITLEDTYFAK
ncbi:ABC transporter substrate-binding protein [Tepidanaerobacter sp. EBM-49]|nr:ABC transporter substrate-binding protein [Tepidanaerobacter sp. EBM-49]